jgi:hypothetical protein
MHKVYRKHACFDSWAGAQLMSDLDHVAISDIDSIAVARSAIVVVEADRNDADVQFPDLNRDLW